MEQYDYGWNLEEKMAKFSHTRVRCIFCGQVYQNLTLPSALKHRIYCKIYRAIYQPVMALVSTFYR